jgi:hypothetical protein
MMVHFVIEQRWVTEGGKLQGEVIEISDEGISGVVEVIDDKGDRDAFRGTAAAFQQLPGHWQVVT